MPVPKNLEAKYSVIVATQTKRLKAKGMGHSEANTKAKAIADKWVSDQKK